GGGGSRATQSAWCTEPPAAATGSPGGSCPTTSGHAFSGASPAPPPASTNASGGPGVRRGPRGQSDPRGQRLRPAARQTSLSREMISAILLVRVLQGGHQSMGIRVGNLGAGKMGLAHFAIAQRAAGHGGGRGLRHLALRRLAEWSRWNVSLRLAVAPAWPAEPVGGARPATRRMRARTPLVLVACIRLRRGA